ncbi:sorting nexin-8-like [Saccoglossus kowalevskii]|uniref:Sorting nexin-8-like n=1 Tax=Saccoglossus kowalevskii TaxID=10224 RepID=A0ABM0MP95_SACKO|nr:PREDICTED: sorting nexin-8-like [Saccoglossus kowalevskii]
MAADLAFGSVPPYYREVYNIVCPTQESKVDRDMFVRLLMKSSLPKQTLSEIWDVVDSKQGYLTRNGLYKALALVALAQQGKSINEKILETYSDQELPKPSLGDLSDLKSLSIQVRREHNPNLLGYSYHELCDLDNIKVELAPEKRGLILKHNEYEVTSQAFKSTAMRRYNDFLAFQEMLLQRFPYRLVPRLPPKKMLGADREFIEARRKSLRRFLTLVSRHPVFRDSPILKFFFTFQGSDMQHKLKELFRGIPDEFMTSCLAAQAKDLVPLDTQLQFGNAKEQIRAMFSAFTKMKEMAERMARRSAEQASDMLLVCKELTYLSQDTPPSSAWACGNNDTWSDLKRGFKPLSVEFAGIADKCAQQSAREEDTVVEMMNLFLDLLTSFRDLCERHEKGVLKDHQTALARIGNMKKKKMTATIKGQEQAGTVEQLESRIIEQESEIMNMENRNYFSLHCLQMETQLIHANVEVIAEIFQLLVHIEVKGSREINSLWEDLQPKVNNLIPRDVSNATSNPGSPVTSPLASPTSERVLSFP